MTMTQTEAVLMRKRRGLDHLLLALVAALAAAGFVMMGSASMDYAAEQFGKDRSQRDAAVPLRRDDLQLICFEFVTG